MYENNWDALRSEQVYRREQLAAAFGGGRRRNAVMKRKAARAGRTGR